jgi:glyoxylase-like metal-dependent hydrolase (beta-lactamase superfamily II)
MSSIRPPCALAPVQALVRHVACGTSVAPPRHISLFRDSDRTLIAGDAVVTTRQESALAVATQRLELHGPPAYYTQDWGAAGRSVQALAALSPETLATGHGEPWSGAEMRRRLHGLAANFHREIPAFGRYSRQPAVTDEHGIVSLPPDPLPAVLAGAALAAAVAVGLATAGLRRSGPRHD